jgi:hypothetical protein
MRPGIGMATATATAIGRESNVAHLLDPVMRIVLDAPDPRATSARTARHMQSLNPASASAISNGKVTTARNGQVNATPAVKAAAPDRRTPTAHTVPKTQA